MISDTLNIDNLREMCIDFYNQSKYKEFTNGFDDIVLTGSFVYGFVSKNSDVDLIVFTTYKDNHRFSNYNLLVKIFYIDGRKYALYIMDTKYKSRKFMGFQIPRYSLITKTIYNFNKNDVVAYILKKSENLEWLIGREWFENVCGISKSDLNIT